MMSICLTWVPISGLGKPNIYHNLENFTRMWDFTWMVSDCEELEGGIHTGDDGLILQELEIDPFLS